MERIMMISSDCHAGMRTDEYPAYMEEAYQDDLAVYIDRQREKLQVRKEQMAKIQGVQPDNGELQARRWEAEQRQQFATNLESRIEPSEADGFVAEVIFPDDGSFDNKIPFTGMFGGVSEYPVDHQAAALRAYNRWFRDTHVKHRQIGLALIPLHDPEYAVSEVNQARSFGMAGVMPEFDGVATTLYDSALDPVWAACANEGLPVHFHAGSGVPVGLYELGGGAGTLAEATELQFWARRALWYLIHGGVLERHPGLQVAFTETFADWIPRTLGHMDWQYGNLPEAKRPIPMKPSEYWHRQCFVGAHAASVAEWEMRHSLGIDTLTYGTDFPHSGSPWGCSNEFLRSTMGAAGVCEAEARAALGENAARFYGVDQNRLAHLVDQFGPLPTDVLTPATDSDLRKLPAYIKAKVHRPFSA